MDVERLLRVFQIFFKVLVILIVSSTAFFYLNKNTALKRTVWPLVVVTTGAMFFGFLWLMGIALPLRLMGSAAIVLSIAINLRSIRFCDSCSAMSRSPNPLVQATVCSKCGTELK